MNTRVGFLGAALAGAVLLTGCGGPTPPPIVVGSKNGTTQVLLAEILAQQLERKLQRKVDRNYNLGNSKAVYQAMLLGQVDLYVEDVGAARAEIFQFDMTPDPANAIERTRQEFEKSQMQFYAPLGFSNAYVVAVAQETAAKHKLTKLTEADAIKTGWKLGASLEFMDRIDGMAALQRAYSFEWDSPPRRISGSGAYSALSKKEISLLAGQAIDGPLAGGNYVILEDDKHAFGPYDAGVVVRTPKTYEVQGLKEAIQALMGKMDTATMRQLTGKADATPTSVAQIAAEFLASH